MDLVKVLAQLRQELASLDAAIESLERLNEGGQRRRRYPSKTLSATGAGSPEPSNGQSEREDVAI
jgi:hypothetical protein